MQKNEYISKFNIPFGSLPFGIHRYEYEIENKFFDSFENSAVHDGSIHVALDVDRQDALLIMNFALTGNIQLECDRCLGKFDFTVNENSRLVVKLESIAPEGGHEEDDVITISKEEHSINIASHLFDYISLMIPYRKVHPDDAEGKSGCDPEILKKIEGLSHHEENHNDPRWDALKKLKKKK